MGFAPYKIDKGTLSFKTVYSLTLTHPLYAEWHIRPRGFSNVLFLKGRVVSPALNPQPGGPGRCLVWPLSRRPIQHG